MSKKVQTCCFCNRVSIGSEIGKWGAWAEETGNYLCMDCVVMIYNGILNEISKKGLDDIFEEEV